MTSSLTTAGNSGTEQLWLLAKIARMYHERGLRQPQIAAELQISQSHVSRLLRQASQVGIVRTTVSLPSGVYTGIEEQLEARYQLQDSVVVDTDGDLLGRLGAAAATYLRETLCSGDVVGVSSWSVSLSATVEAMRPKTGLVVRIVTQLVAANGDPRVQVEAARLINRFANLTGARPVLLPSPEVVENQMERRALLCNPAIASVLRSWRELSVALVGVGCMHHSPLQHSTNAIAPRQQSELMELGAVGDVCFRFFDQDGNLIKSAFSDRLLAIGANQLKAIPRRIAVAGGPGNVKAIAAAAKGGWINTLITDLQTAHLLLQDHVDDAVLRSSNNGESANA